MLNGFHSSENQRVSFVREIPAYAGFYGAYEYTKRTFQTRVYPGQDLPVWTLMCSGATGGIAYWSVAVPFHSCIHTSAVDLGIGFEGWHRTRSTW